MRWDKCLKYSNRTSEPIKQSASIEESEAELVASSTLIKLSRSPFSYLHFLCGALLHRSEGSHLTFLSQQKDEGSSILHSQLEFTRNNVRICSCYTMYICVILYKYKETTIRFDIYDIHSKKNTVHKDKSDIIWWWSNDVYKASICHWSIFPAGNCTSRSGFRPCPGASQVVGFRFFLGGGNPSQNQNRVFSRIGGAEANSEIFPSK